MRIAMSMMIVTALALGVIAVGPRMRKWWELNAYPVLDVGYAAREPIPFTMGDWAATRSTDWGTRVSEMVAATRPVERPVSTLYGTPAPEWVRTMHMVTPDDASVPKHTRDINGYAGATASWGDELRNTPQGTLVADDDPANDKRWDARRHRTEYTDDELKDAEWDAAWRTLDNHLEAARRTDSKKLIEIMGPDMEQLLREMDRMHWAALDAGIKTTGIESSLELVAAW